MDKELFGWLHTKNCGQQLIVHMHTSGEWCPLGVSTEPTLFDIFVVNMDSGKANGTLGYMASRSGGDSALLFCSCNTLHRVLHPVLVSLT